MCSWNNIVFVSQIGTDEQLLVSILLAMSVDVALTAADDSW